MMSDTPNVSMLDGMTEEGILKLINDAIRGGGAMLPPGAYRDESGKVWRDALEPTGRVRPVKDDSGKVVRTEQVLRRVKRPVYLTYDLSPEGLVAGRKAAARRGLDFYWPGPGLDGAPGLPSPATRAIGWLRNGTKREVDVDSNLGAGAERFEMVYEPIEAEDDQGASSVTMQGVAIEEPPPATPPDDADRPDPFSDDAVREAAAQSGGRRPQRGH